MAKKSGVEELRKIYLRPIIIGIALAMFGELGIFLIFGVYLYPEGNLLKKFLWTVGFCGIGMGSTMGALIDLFVVGRLDGIKGAVAVTVISALTLGVGCNLLCFNLDRHFHYFGGQAAPDFFILNGFVMAVFGGVIASWLLFSKRGGSLLDRVRI